MIPDRTLDRILASVPRFWPGLTPRVIGRDFEDLSPGTVRQSLAVLVAHGRIRFEGEIGHRTYWQPNPSPSNNQAPE